MALAWHALLCSPRAAQLTELEQVVVALTKRMHERMSSLETVVASNAGAAAGAAAASMVRGGSINQRNNPVPGSLLATLQQQQQRVSGWCAREGARARVAAL